MEIPGKPYKPSVSCRGGPHGFCPPKKHLAPGSFSRVFKTSQTLKNIEKTSNNLENSNKLQKPSIGYWIVPIGPPQQQHSELS